VIGGLFIGDGTQKLFGWFGGPGLEGTEQMMGALDMRPTRPNALAAGSARLPGARCSWLERRPHWRRPA
jgi:putative oxidoreductase